MPVNFRELLKIPSARLSRRIVVWVFASVIVIEAIIFIPSYRNRRDELLHQLKDVSKAQVAMIMRLAPPEVADHALLDWFKRIPFRQTVRGGALYSPDGPLLGGFGEPPELGYPGRRTEYLDAARYRYDVLCMPSRLGKNYPVIIRHDALSVKLELRAFMLRIAGLVFIISIFVTVGAMVALEPLVVTPILRLRGDLIRAGEAVHRDQAAPRFDSAAVGRPDELGEVIDAFRQMFGQISDAISERKEAEFSLQQSLQQVEAYSKALNYELEKGRQMQTNFLPARLTPPPGWEMAALFQPARQVAGDFYDVFDLPHQGVGLVVADVCDKGVGAALFMALFRSLIRIFSGQTSLRGLDLAGGAGTLGADAHGRPDTARPNPHHLQALEAVRLTNNYVVQNHGDLGMFATLFFGVLDPATGLLSYINGGHLSPYVIDATGVRETLKPCGPAVGVLRDAVFESRWIRLHPGDMLVGFTDGVTDALSPRKELFGSSRLQSLLHRPSASVAEAVERIRSDLSAFVGDEPQEDDITLLAVQRTLENGVHRAGTSG